MGPQAHAQEAYGGFVFSIFQTESGAPRMEFGPTVRYDRDRLGASGSLQFELNERGQLQRVTAAPEVSVNVEFADVTYGPRLNLRPWSAQPVALMRSDDVLPRVEGVGFNDVLDAVRTVSAGSFNPAPDLTQEEWDQLMAFVNQRWNPVTFGEQPEIAPVEPTRFSRVSVRNAFEESLELQLPSLTLSAPTLRLNGESAR
jgi:hypothetical protein